MRARLGGVTGAAEKLLAICAFRVAHWRYTQEIEDYGQSNPWRLGILALIEDSGPFKSLSRRPGWHSPYVAEYRLLQLRVALVSDGYNIQQQLPEIYTG